LADVSLSVGVLNASDIRSYLLSEDKSNGLSVIVAPSGEGCRLMFFFRLSGHAWTMPGIKAGQ